MKGLIEFQQPLNKVLADSPPDYESKLLAQTEVIKDEINGSMQQITARLEAESHDKVIPPDRNGEFSSDQVQARF